MLDAVVIGEQSAACYRNIRYNEGVALSQLYDLIHQGLISGGKRQDDHKIVYLGFDLGKLSHLIAGERVAAYKFVACKNAGKRNGLFPKDTHDLFCTIAHPVDKDRACLRL